MRDRAKPGARVDQARQAPAHDPEGELDRGPDATNVDGRQECSGGEDLKGAEDGEDGDASGWSANSDVAWDLWGGKGAKPNLVPRRTVPVMAAT